MTTLDHVRRLKRPTLLIVFLFIAAVAHSEIPENFQLRDDVSNDIAFTGTRCHSLQPHAVDRKGSPTLGSGQVKLVSVGTEQIFQFHLVAEPFHLSGQDRLLLWSIHRT
jgi:hypothetical protein